MIYISFKMLKNVMCFKNLHLLPSNALANIVAVICAADAVHRVAMTAGVSPVQSVSATRACFFGVAAGGPIVEGMRVARRTGGHWRKKIMNGREKS